MGSGIAQVAARAGYSVVLSDISEELLRRALGTIDKNLQRDVEKERLSPNEKKDIIQRIRLSVNFDALIDAEVVVEAVSENFCRQKPSVPSA
ncbi:MAG: 3-hydroxyacyl-CoA dehydrogenase NAD-binding domain-containing protein [Pyrinomonadaceae bacterium]